MSKRSDRAAERKAARRAQQQAEQDLRAARTAARKAFDLKDPRFLGEAAVAATRGPAGLALFGASRGLQVARDKRAENAKVLDSLATDAKQHAESVREQAADLADPPTGRRSRKRRRFLPLSLVGLAGGAAVAGATAYFLRDQGSSSSSSPSPAPAPTSGPGPVDTPDPEGPARQGTDTTPAAAEPDTDTDTDTDSVSGTDAGASAPAPGSAAPGAAAGTAPQPADAVDPGQDSSDK